MRWLALVLLVACAGVGVASGQQQDPDDPVWVPKLPEPSFPSGKAHVETDEELRTLDEPGKPLLRWERLTGDWGGTRARWQIKGIFPELVYYTEFFSKIAGGETSGVDASILGKLDLSLTLDTERLGWWEDGYFFFYFESLHGDTDGVNGPVGKSSPVNTLSSLNAEPFDQVGAYYWVQYLLDRKLAFKIGKQDANADFVASDVSGEFVNGGVSPPPHIPMPTYPNPGFGFALGWVPVSWLDLKGGIYGGDPDGTRYDDAGLFSGQIFTIFQVDLLPSPGPYGGTYRVGGWYRKGDPEDVGEGTPISLREHNHGFYALFDQPLWLEDPHGESDEGLRGFFQFSWVPEDRNAVDVWVGGGLVYSGLFPGRPRDDLGFGVYSARPSKRLRRLSNETILEWYYKLKIAEWIYLKPDLQWILNPGGDGRNALALGLRLMLAF